jgi:hypothetical protein
LRPPDPEHNLEAYFAFVNCVAGKVFLVRPGGLSSFSHRISVSGGRPDDPGFVPSLGQTHTLLELARSGPRAHGRLRPDADLVNSQIHLA